MNTTGRLAARRNQVKRRYVLRALLWTTGALGCLIGAALLSGCMGGSEPKKPAANYYTGPMAPKGPADPTAKPKPGKTGPNADL